MRKAMAVWAVLPLLLVGCGTAIGGMPSADPLVQQSVAADVSAFELSASASEGGAVGSPTVSTSIATSTSRSRPSASSTTASSTTTSPTTTSSTATESTATESAAQTTSQSSTDTAAQSSPVDPTEIVPPPSEGSLTTEGNGDVNFDGFQYFDFDDGIYLRWAEDREYQCSNGQVDGCWGILIFSVTGCADGVKVTLSISGADGATIGTATGTSGALAPNTQQLLILGDSTGYVGENLAYVDVVGCIGR